MKKIALVLILMVNITLMSCSAPYYSADMIHEENKTLNILEEGKTYIDNGDYDKAVTYFEDALIQNPKRASFHNYLAIAYMKIGNIDKAWYHARKAVRGEFTSFETSRIVSYDNGNGKCYLYFDALVTFMDIYKVIVTDQGLDKKGTDYRDIITALGEPDLKFSLNDNDDLFLQYGMCTMQFVQGKLVENLFPKLMPPS